MVLRKKLVPFVRDVDITHQLLYAQNVDTNNVGNLREANIYGKMEGIIEGIIGHMFVNDVVETNGYISAIHAAILYVPLVEKET